MRVDASHPLRPFALLLALVISLFSFPAGAEEGEENESTEETTEVSESTEGSDEAEKKDEGEKSAFDEIMQGNAPAASEEGNESAGAGPEESATVEVPLAEYSDVARRLGDIRRSRARDTGPRVVLGGAAYEGEVARGVLALRVKLHVTLAGDGPKTVPLVGDDVALVSASADGEPVGVTRRPGYHVWITDRRGAIDLELSLLVAPRGPRGSIEYAFRAARTPSTRLSIRLPTEGLAPRFDGAVQSEVRAEKGSTLVRATLEPTTEIRLVGFRDLGSEAQQSARVYAETQSLLSIDERAIELFTAVRYNILYSSTQSFELFVPEGLEVVSADGEGAFRYDVEPREGGGSVLRGETAFPIQGGYELSLRLRYRTRDVSRGAREPLRVLLPRCLGVEREHGWLAVEVPGKLKLDEVTRKDLVAVDVRQLPSDVVGSAVSPILRAYRHHEAQPALDLAIERLPEEELSDGAIDRIDAVSVLSPEGKLFTELRITLRNALRPSLLLTLPQGAEVRSALLDGEPVEGSRNERGELLLPLKRSRGEERQEPFSLEVVLESTTPALGILGRSALALPATDLTAATLHWQLYLPANNHYGDLRAAVGAQTYAGAASWHKPPHLTRAVRWDEDGSEAQNDANSTSGAGARSELPRTGVELVHRRYWVAAGEAVRVEVPFVRWWLLLPFELWLALLLAAGMGMAKLSDDAPLRAKAMRAGRVAACVGLGLALWGLGGAFYAGGAALAGLAFLAEKRGLRGRLSSVRAIAARMPSRVSAWWRRQAWSRRRVARGAGIAAGTAVIAWMLVQRIGWLVKAIAELAGGSA
ncbi:hypothetical protein [Polyangium aurulentum]|uniref:hypothetical protein n=1 Tax=Polyangium aurulentum TaxID=2567896 RepID=UPI0010AEDAC0|nr:hypothetical protein [Polyangium aurulentum]UQA54734.1 hypothetical protein E8A73_025520 [Polyangium aurulentum]